MVFSYNISSLECVILDNEAFIKKQSVPLARFKESEVPLVESAITPFNGILRSIVYLDKVLMSFRKFDFGPLTTDDDSVKHESIRNARGFTLGLLQGRIPSCEILMWISIKQVTHCLLFTLSSPRSRRSRVRRWHTRSRMFERRKWSVTTRLEICIHSSSRLSLGNKKLLHRKPLCV